jgi:cell division protein FtsW (lipid II flippase)
MITEREPGTPHRSPMPYLLAPVPALALGLLVMRASGVPAALWGQNVAAWLVGTLLVAGVWRTRTSRVRVRSAVLMGVFTLGMLVATLLVPGMDGVHRWVPLGPVRLHAAALLLPLLLAVVERLARVRGWWISAVFALTAACVLVLQPDAAQATAFAAAAAILLLPGAGRAAQRVICVLMLPVLAGVAWLRRDPLAPVPYVEKIVELAAGLGTGWAVAAVVSLLLLPAPFVLGGRGAARRLGLALGTYVAITVIAPFLGNFPVPVMGFGMSPILGYFAGMSVLLRLGARRIHERPDT